MRLFVALTGAYLIAPGHPLSLLTGIPLSPLSLSVLVVGGIATFALWRATTPRWSAIACWVIGGLLAAKVVLWLAAPEYGLPAWYFANSRFQGDHERSTEFPFDASTRRDVEIAFGGDEFPVHFLNDTMRFNYFGPDADRRRNLPFSTRWRGTLAVPNDGAHRLWLTASGPAALQIDGRQIASVDADGRDTRAADVDLAAGPHELTLTYARRPPRSGDLKVEWDLGGARQSLAVPYLLAAPLALDAWQRDQGLGAFARLVDALFLATIVAAALGLAWARYRAIRAATGSTRWLLTERPLLGLFLFVIFMHAAIPELDRADKMTLLGGGQDWLTHETMARDILLNGPLMTLGKALGEGRTFYAQPFYPYALAGMHWLAGEELFGPTVLQLFSLGVSGVLLYYVARRLFGTPAGVGTLVVFAGLRIWQLDWVARRLLSESVYFVLLPAAFLVMLRYLDERRPRDLMLAGLLLGLCVITRGPTLLYLPLAAVLIALALRREGASPGDTRVAVAALVGIALGVAAAVPIRNWVVARQPAIVASSGGVNLEKLHRPTPQVRLAEANRRWYANYVHDVPTREVLEFIQQDPLGYAATYVPLALYSLGYGAAIDESQIILWTDLVLMNVLYVGAIVGSPRARSLRAGLLHAFIAVHFATVLIFAPYDYENRLVLPMYLPMSVFVGFVVGSITIWAFGRLRAERRGGSVEVLVGVASAAGGARAAGMIRRP